jgi:hypothetical protein
VGARRGRRRGRRDGCGEGGGGLILRGFWGIVRVGARRGDGGRKGGRTREMCLRGRDNRLYSVYSIPLRNHAGRLNRLLC